MHPFMRKLLFEKQIKHEAGGYLMVLGSPGYLLSLNVMVIVHKLLEEEFGKKGSDVFYKILEIQTKMGAKMMIKRFGYSPQKALEMQQGHAEMIGAGTVDLVHVDTEKNQYILRAQSTYAKEYLKTFGLQKYPVDVLFRGGMTSLLREMTQNEDLICIETQCIAQGKPYCEFVIKNKSEFNLKDSLIKRQLPEKFKFDLSKLTDKPVPLAAQR
ncbi:4-vinyl reductase [Candidatus Woesearchaeota archaeon]|nr:4-vinyl reductase [Candidatus Woesearchaeota archaeon]